MSRTKRERVPMGGSRMRLDVKLKDPKQKEKFVFRWFNDQDSRIEDASAAGYEPVQKDEVIGVGQTELHQDNSDLNSRVSKVVGRAEGNVPIRAFLMKIPREFYDEDQAAKDRRNAESDRALRGGKAGGADVENQYGEVRIDDSGRP